MEHGQKHKKYHLYNEVITVEISSLLHKITDDRNVYCLHFAAPIVKNNVIAEQESYSAEVGKIEKELKKYIRTTLTNLHNTDNTLNTNYILSYQQAPRQQKNTKCMYPTLDLYIAYNNQTDEDKRKYKPFNKKLPELQEILNNLIEEWTNIRNIHDFTLLQTNHRHRKRKQELELTEEDKQDTTTKQYRQQDIEKLRQQQREYTRKYRERKKLEQQYI